MLQLEVLVLRGITRGGRRFQTLMTNEEGVAGHSCGEERRARRRVRRTMNFSP